jgi:uncharacterized protein
MQEISARIRKDIDMFQESVGKMKSVELEGKEKAVYDLAVDYRNDSESWLEKGDFYTAFASISYAHGLLDALIRIKT